ncbi:MAG: hypothetical protein N2652_01410 [Kiritimatiellae bacterium]|nr:hypothetical protein [Kiritimatiellia bacterium]
MTAPVSVREVYTLRRADRLKEAIAAARSLFQRHPSDPNTRHALAWCLVNLAWAALRRADTNTAHGHVEDLDPLVDSSDVQFHDARARLQDRPAGDPRAHEILKRLVQLAGDSAASNPLRSDSPRTEGLRLLRQYARLTALKRPGGIHSQILSTAIRLHRQIPRFVAFARWWDPAHLQEADWQRPAKTSATRSSDAPPRSLVERLIAALAHYRQHPDFTRDNLAPFEPVWTRALQRFPDNNWLLYQVGVMLTRLGREADAQPLLLRFVERHPDDWWSWSALAEAYAGEPRTAAALLARAIRSAARQPHPAQRLRRQLSEYAARLGRPEVTRALLAKPAVQQPAAGPALTHKPDQATDMAALDWWIAELAARADALVFPTNVLGVITRHDTAHHLTVIAIGPARVALGRRPLWPEVALPRPGSNVLVALAAPLEPGRPALVQADRFVERPHPSDFARRISGRFQRHPRGFGFVGDIFVHATHARHLADGAVLRGIATLDAPARHPGRRSWAAIPIEVEPDTRPRRSGDLPCPA